MEIPAVSIIILNYQRGTDVLECLESVTHIDYPAYEVTVVDNGSTDNSLLNIRKRYPQVRIIENGRNLGYAEGNNIGIREKSCPYFLLLNDDAVVGKSILKDLVEAVQADPRAGIAGPAILYHEDRDRIWCAGGRISLFGYASHIGKGQRIESRNSLRPVEYICGCAILIRREVINQIGLLDPEYFSYFEDADYCFRARRAGYRCLYVPSPTVWHKAGADWVVNPVQAYYYMRNAIIFARKNLRGLRRIIFIWSQLFLMLPYYFLMLIWKDPGIVKNLTRGLRDGLAAEVG
jgi:GT2 family glycosyltransferase